MSNWLKKEHCENTAFEPRKNDDVNTGLPLGLLKSDGKNHALSPINYHGRAHMFCVAPSGAGKSQSLAIPALLEWPHSAIVLDVKGELFFHTAGYREKELGHKIYRFDPSDPKGHKFNPLSFIDNDQFAIEQSVTDIVDVIIPIPDDVREKFFLRAARQILSVAIHYLVWQSPSVTPPMRHLVKLCYDVSLFHEALEKIVSLDIDKQNGLPDSIRNIANGLRAQFFAPDSHTETDLESQPQLNRAGQSVWAELANQISPLNSEQIKAVTKTTDWTPSSLRAGKTTVYVTLPPSAKGQYRAIMALVLNAHLGQLLNELPDHDSPPILILLDEMPQLGHMRAIEQVIDLGRGYGLLLYGFSQRRSQIKKAYGDDSDFLGTFEVRAYMNPSPEDGTADMLSKAIGERSKPSGTGAQMSTVSVAPANELCGRNFKDDIIILSRGCNPARVKKSMAYQDETLCQKMKIQSSSGKRYAPLKEP